MTETLTESFCERCGTRYEFHAPTRLNPLRKTRGLFGGLRNYLTSQDALSDAIGDAMRSEEEGLASAQLDAFHESFNFCIDCRQYTCVNCWNDDAGRCRSCAPIPGTDDLAERLAASLAAPPLATDRGLERGVGLEAWPSSDLPSEDLVATNGHAVELWPATEAPPAQPAPEREPESEWIAAEVDVAPIAAEAEPEPIVAEAEAAIEPEPVAAQFEIEPEPEAVAAEIEPEPVATGWETEPQPFIGAFEPEPWPAEGDLGPEPIVAEVEPEPAPRPMLRVVAWDEDSAYEILEPEPVAAGWEVEAEPEPAAAVFEPEPEPEPIVAEVEPAPEPEPVAAVIEPEPEPEPVAAEIEPEPEPGPVPIAPRIAPIRETILRFPSRPAPATTPVEVEPAAAVDDSPELAARRAQLDSLGLRDLGEGPVAPGPQPLPYRSRGAGVSQAELARQAVLRGSFWEASAREVAGAAGRVGVQNCGRCGLSLSASARFCRRCGTPQAQSA